MSFAVWCCASFPPSGFPSLVIPRWPPKRSVISSRMQAPVTKPHPCPALRSGVPHQQKSEKGPQSSRPHRLPEPAWEDGSRSIGCPSEQVAWGAKRGVSGLIGRGREDVQKHRRGGHAGGHRNRHPRLDDAHSPTIAPAPSFRIKQFPAHAYP